MKPGAHIALMMPVFRRPRLTRVVANYYRPQCTMDLLAITSFDDDVPYWPYVDYPNEPLGAKLNAGLNMLRKKDAVLLVGSDDLLTSAYLTHVQDRIAAGYDVVRLQACYYLDLTRERPVLFKSPRALPGAGVALSRRVLDAYGWKMWNDSLNSSLDGSMFRRLAQWAIHHPDKPPLKTCKVRHADADMLCLDVKTHEGNLWRIEGEPGNRALTFVQPTTGRRIVHRSVEWFEPSAFLNRHFPGAKDQLLQLRPQMAST